MLRFVMLIMFATGSAQAATWQVVPALSKLSFQGTYEGEAFDGRFQRFTPTIAFDAADAAKIAIDTSVDLASVDTQNQERDDALTSTEFFDTARFPKARFTTTACRGAAPRFTCDATLTIRGKQRPLKFPFTWTANADGTARLTARVTLNRLDFDVGTGDWADTELIENAVRVSVDLRLKPKP